MMDERIASVYEWQNGLVMVFDRDGHQMPQWQDQSAKDRLRDVFPERLWHKGVWGSHVVTPRGEVQWHVDPDSSDS